MAESLAAELNRAVLERFYTCFQARDADGMAACYAPDAVFSDEVFQDLHSAEIGSMWKMLCERGKDLTLTFGDVAATEQHGSVRWEARYTFSTTGRKVHNRIEATFTFESGKIKTHRDRFDLWRWAAQALGITGIFFGWLPAVQHQIRKTATTTLKRYIDKTAPL